MDFFKIIYDIPIMIVLGLFITSLIYTINKYMFANRNLKLLHGFLLNFKKTDLNYRFKEIDEWMSKNPYVFAPWMEFKNTLVFSESIALKGQNNNLTYKEVSSTVQYIQTTVDPLYFFEEDSLITSKFNYKFIQSVSTILTGCGPLFTFLNIAIAFGKVNFASQDQTLSSLSGLIASMQTAALVSVIAVGLKETKIQNNSLQHIIGELPEDFKIALNSGIASNLVPYLENLIFGMNLLNKNVKEALTENKKDDVDDLF